MLGKRRRGSTSSENLQFQDNVRWQESMNDTSTTAEQLVRVRSPQYRFDHNIHPALSPGPATASTLHPQCSQDFQSQYQSQLASITDSPSQILPHQINHLNDTLPQGVTDEDCRARPSTETLAQSANFSDQQRSPSIHSSIQVKADTSILPSKSRSHIGYSNTTQQLSFRRLGNSSTPSNSATPQDFQRELQPTEVSDHPSTVHEQQEATCLPDTEDQRVSFSESPHSASLKPVANAYSSKSDRSRNHRHDLTTTDCVDSASRARASKPSSPEPTSPPQRSEHQLTHSSLTQLQETESLAGHTHFPAPFDTLSRARSPSPLELESVKERTNRFSSNWINVKSEKDPDWLVAEPENDPEWLIAESEEQRSICNDSGMSTPGQAEKILWGYRIFIDRGTPLPEKLQNLVDTIKQPRLGGITPNSKHVAAANNHTSKLNELDSMIALIDRLTYRGQLYPGDDGGEHSVQRTFDCQWLDRVPRPAGGTEEDEKILQAAMQAIGCPSKPKPDVTFGYTEEMFDVDHLKRLCAWYPDVLVLDRAPWFPYSVAEWKGKDKTLTEARVQARRDGSAANGTLYDFYQRSGNSEPSVDQTCVFSLCIDSTVAEYRVHWRHVDGEGKVSYEAERVASALLHDGDMVFRLRGCILNTLDWARGDRLTSIRKALTLMKQPPPKPPKASK
ncbi:MAG: hypothetical protein Q9216_002060 [Gyalolechia sp. 2 TL-2023]